MATGNTTTVSTGGMTPSLADKIAEARGMFDAYVAAERAVLLGQSYQIAGQSLTRANLSEIRNGRKEWQATLDMLTGNSRRIIKNIIPVDRYAWRDPRYF